MQYKTKTSEVPSAGMTTDIKFCPKCGAIIPPDAPQQSCIACLLETALDTVGADDVDLAIVDPKSTPAITEFGDYELLEEIGRGGQGVVFRARQKSLNRTVALKMISLGHWATEEHLKRFRLEAEAAANLDHPRIVPIYEIGERDGSCYFSMKLVEGGQLDEVARQKRIPIRRAAELLVKIARTVQYAHQRGVLHRDIKPGNILLDADGEPHLTDFGLARLVEKESTVTQTAQILGTPSYMAPEQAAGKNEQLTTAADVYGIGAICYQLLTGVPPFAGGTTYETIKLVLESSPRRPSVLNSAVSRDLEIICLKCLEKEPAKRYSSAKSVADDLERFLRDEPIASRPVSRTERVWRWCKRKPLIAGLSAGLVLILLAGLASVLWELNRAQQEELIARRNLYCADMNLAQQAWEEGNLQRAQSLLRAHLPEPGREDLRGFEWRYLWQLCRDESRFTFPNIHFYATSATTGGTDRRQMVSAGDGRMLICASGSVLKWLDTQNRREVKTVDVGDEKTGPLTLATNRSALLAYSDGKVIHCLSATGEALLGGGVTYDHCGTLALSSDGSLLASGGLYFAETAPVKLWDVRTGKQLGEFNFSKQSEGAIALAFSPDGKFLVCSTSDYRVVVLDLPQLRFVRQLEGHRGGWTTSFAFNNTGTLLAAGARDGKIIIWSFPDGRETARFTGHSGSINDVTFSPDQQTLASAGGDQTVRIWSLGSPTSHTILRGHRGAVRAALFSDDGKELYSGSDDGTVKVWKLPGSNSDNLVRTEGLLLSLSFSPDGKLLVGTDTSRGKLYFWDLARKERREQATESQLPQKVAFSPDGQFLAVSGFGSGVKLWDMARQTVVLRLALEKLNGMYWIDFHPSKPILATAGQSIRFWDTHNGEETRLLRNPPTEGLIRVNFSGDGKWLALGSKNGEVEIWSLGSGVRVHTFAESSGRISRMCFSSNAKLLAVVRDDYRTTIYDVLRARALATLEPHTGPVWGLDFTPDNKGVVSASFDGTIKFSSLATQQQVLSLSHDGAPVVAMAISPRGDLIATSGSDETLRFWRAPSLAEIDAATSR